MNKNISKILLWISRYWYPSIPVETRRLLIKLWINKVNLWINCNGMLHTIKRIKIIRLIVTRYMCGSPLLVNDMMIGVTKDGFPKVLIPFKELFDGENPEGKRFLLTCLGISRSFRYEAKPDLSSITDKFSGKFKTLPKDFINRFVNDFCLEYTKERPTPSSFFLNMKAGPQKGSALLHAHLSIQNFTGSNIWGLVSLVGLPFMEWLKSVKLSMKDNVNRSEAPLSNRRLHVVNDPEAKARVIAIFDYISQVAFNPVSEYLFETLKTIPQDRTFTQDPVIIDKKDGQRFHSLDLSSATDRFPIDLQVDLLSPIIGEYQAKGWKNLMVNEPFITPDGKSTVKYAVGQPMGARSSWAAFTLSHHLCVQYAAFQENLYPFSEYILLGDDIVIYNDAVAERYKILIKDLGVSISEAKSHVSEHTYEFAKRWIRNGIEISPIPLRGIIDQINQPKLLWQQFMDLLESGRGPKVPMISSTIALSFMREVLGIPRSKLSYYWRMFENIRFVYRNSKTFDAELTRRVMASATAMNDYILPSDPATLEKEYSRTGSGVVNGMAMSVIKKLSMYYNTYVNSYTTFVAHRGCSLEAIPPIGQHPLTYAIYNSVKSYSDMNKRLNYTLDLNKQLETVTLLDLDKLASQERTSKELIFTFHTAGSGIRNQLRTDHDLYIPKARTMQFGRSLLDIQFALARAFPNVKSESW